MSLKRTGAEALAIIIEQAGRGISSTGAPHPPRADGAPSRLRESGRLLRSIEVEHATDEHVRIVARAPHAGHVEHGTQTAEARPFMGVAPQNMRRLDRAVLADVDRLVLGRR